ncbi:MAG TPA: cell division protein SepF [Mycobacteriales bacterium]|nr:cell division protein SepF [Mycobacteriales bacterium]
MAGVFRKTMVYLGLMEPDEETYDDDGRYDDRYAEPEPVGVRRLGGDDPRGIRRGYADEPRGESRGSLALRPDPRLHLDDEGFGRPAEAATPPYRISTFQPVAYNDIQKIGERYREGFPVIMNLTEMDDKSAMRLIDFASGLIFGLHGTIEKVTNKVFLLSPSNVEVSAEDKARIREGGFFNQS